MVKQANNPGMSKSGQNCQVIHAIAKEAVRIRQIRGGSDISEPDMEMINCSRTSSGTPKETLDVKALMLQPLLSLPLLQSIHNDCAARGEPPQFPNKSIICTFGQSDMMEYSNSWFGVEDIFSVLASLLSLMGGLTGQDSGAATWNACNIERIWRENDSKKAQRQEERQALIQSMPLRPKRWVFEEV